jgi:hypothetical protein
LAGAIPTENQEATQAKTNRKVYRKLAEAMDQPRHGDVDDRSRLDGSNAENESIAQWSERRVVPAGRWFESISVLSIETHKGTQMSHPLQPIVTDDNGTKRFKENSIVRFLKENSSLDLNDLSKLPFPREDWEQFAQLIGYSVSGFLDLSYVSDETADAVAKEMDKP